MQHRLEATDLEHSCSGTHLLMVSKLTIIGLYYTDTHTGSVTEVLRSTTLKVNVSVLLRERSGGVNLQIHIDCSKH
jgi:hypothetical protein